jgi:hypothetical protein
VVDHLTFFIIFMDCTFHKLDQFKNITVIYPVEHHRCRDETLTGKHLEVLKITVLWALTLCSLVERNQYFGGTLHLQVRRVVKMEAVDFSEVIPFYQTA